MRLGTSLLTVGADSCGHMLQVQSDMTSKHQMSLAWSRRLFMLQQLSKKPLILLQRVQDCLKPPFFYHSGLTGLVSLFMRTSSLHAAPLKHTLKITPFKLFLGKFDHVSPMIPINQLGTEIASDWCGDVSWPKALQRVSFTFIPVFGSVRAAVKKGKCSIIQALEHRKLVPGLVLHATDIFRVICTLLKWMHADCIRAELGPVIPQSSPLNPHE